MAQAQSPISQNGQGIYGRVPGNLSLPDPFGDLSSVYPDLGKTNSAVSGDILSKLGGTLSPGTQRALQDAAASRGVSSGMPGSGLSWNSFYGNIAGASEAQQQQGISDFNQTLPTVAGTQTVSPGLQTEIGNQNAINNASPDPAASASHAKELFDQYLSAIRGPTDSSGRPVGSGGASATGSVNYGDRSGNLDGFSTTYSPYAPRTGGAGYGGNAGYGQSGQGANGSVIIGQGGGGSSAFTPRNYWDIIPGGTTDTENVRGNDPFDFTFGGSANVDNSGF